MKKIDLINFENDIANTFNEGKIRAPVHLYSNNEKFLINFFKKIKKNDWVFCSWRSHYQCLLKGVPPKKLKQEILDGKSISLCFPEYKIYSSAIVGGVLPISVGLALSLKRKKSSKIDCDEELLFKIVKLSFQQRRKKIKNSLKKLDIPEVILEDSIFEYRPEQLSSSEFIKLTQIISNEPI